MSGAKASIDIGSNSCLLLVGSFEDNEFMSVHSESAVTGLGRGLDQTEKFSDEAMADTFEALSHYSKKLDELRISKSQVIITATEAARVAKNSKDFFDKIKSELGLQIQVINGEGEAYFSALGASLGLVKLPPECVLMDIGGASTEFIKISTNPFSLKEFVSLPIGVVRVNDWIQEGIFQEKMDQILSSDLKTFESSTLIGVAGTMTSHGAMIKRLSDYNDKEVNGLEVFVEDYLKWKESLDQKSPDQLLKEFPFLGKRAIVSHSGAKIIKAMTEKLKVKKLVVSSFGLRHGTLYQGEIPEKFLS